MLFVTAPERKSRIPSLGASVLAHGVALTVMLLWSVNGPHGAVAPSRHKYSVRFIQLQPLRDYRRKSPPATPGTTAQLQAPATHRVLQAAAASSSSAANAITQEHRQFKLPANLRVQAVKQTLLQLDLPPDLKLKQEMPLPNVLLWTETTPPPFRKRFIAPPAKKVVPKVAQSLPVAPALTLPNGEVTPSELNIASVIPTEMPHLVRPPSVASPVSRTGLEPAPEIPQIGAAESAQPSPANIISLPANPSRNSTLLVLPPGNQVAASDVGSAGLGIGNGIGTGAAGHEAAGNGSATGTSSGGNTVGSAGGNSVGSTGANGTAGAAGGGAAAGVGAGSTGAGHWSATGSAGTLAGIPTGVTRLDLPKEGRFGVVVLGSATSTSYPESAGALSGKVVYTVYLKLGLKKSWILQYCLARGGDAAGDHGSVPVDAPWPYLIMRPDEWSASDPDYIIVHGILTAKGKFDQLSMVFPEQLDKKDLLMKSLNMWVFRPASRDGVPVSVEVLLIIPQEAE